MTAQPVKKSMLLKYSLSLLADDKHLRIRALPPKWFPLNISIALNWVIFYRLICSVPNFSPKYIMECTLADENIQISPKLSLSYPTNESRKKVKNWWNETQRGLTCLLGEILCVGRKMEQCDKWLCNELEELRFDVWKHSLKLSGCHTCTRVMVTFLSGKKFKKQLQAGSHCSVVDWQRQRRTHGDSWYAFNAIWYIARNFIHIAFVKLLDSRPNRILLFPCLWCVWNFWWIFLRSHLPWWECHGRKEWRRIFKI